MGLFETTSRILLVAKADTRDATRKIKDLEGTQRSAAKATLEAQEKQNASLDASIVKLGKLAIAAGVAYGAYRTLSASMREYANYERLVAASRGANIDAIQSSARGLISEEEALRFAAAATNTEFKLSQKQMETAAKYMIVLRNEGNDLTKVYDRVTKAVVEGNAEALKEFGVIIRGRTGDVKTFNAIMAEMERANLAAGDSLERAGDAMQQVGIKAGDTWDKLKRAPGEFVSSSLDEWAKLIHYQKASQASLAANWRQILAYEQTMYQVMLAGGLKAYRGQREQFLSFMAGMGTALREWDRKTFGEGSRFMPLQMDPLDLGKKPRGPREKGFELTTPALSAWEVHQRQLEKEREALKKIHDELIKIEDSERRLGWITGGMSGSPTQDKGKDEKKQKKQKKQKEADPYKAFSQMIAQNEVLSASFRTLEDAGASAWAALITGSKGFGEAMREAFGQGLLALSAEMFGRALYHGAMALAALAFGGPKAGMVAAKHGKTAAAFAAGAVATGALASALGVGGGKGAQVPGGGARTPQGGGDDMRSETIIIGMLDDNPRRMRRGVRDMLDRADAEAGPGTTIVRY